MKNGEQTGFSFIAFVFLAALFPYSFRFINSVGFATAPRLGWGFDSQKFNGYIAEVMFLEGVLNNEERDAVTSRYLKPRFNLWDSP